MTLSWNFVRAAPGGKYTDTLKSWKIIYIWSKLCDSRKVVEGMSKVFYMDTDVQVSGTVLAT